MYDWADDQFDKNDEKPQWQFVEVNDILLMGNTRTGVLYEREAHTEGETYFPMVADRFSSEDKERLVNRKAIEWIPASHSNTGLFLTPAKEY